MGIFKKKNLEKLKRKAERPKKHAILIVDDEIENLNVLHGILSENYDVYTAIDGRQALDLIEDPDTARRIHLIITDQRMPRMTGVAFLEQSQRIIPEAMRIILTGYSDMEATIDAINKGRVFQYIQKPFDHRNLMMVVERALETYVLKRTNADLIDELKALNADLELKVQERTRQLEMQNSRIMSSIDYAKRIQQAILPETALLCQALPDFAVLYMPKDVVSGDFYWFHQKGDSVFLAVGDCTGHGVPGAFMSMIGSTLLNELVVKDGLEDPALILERLHLAVRYSLKQDSQDNHVYDGMELGLCRFERRGAFAGVVFAGARRPLLIVRTGALNGGEYELLEVKGDRKPIGGKQRESKRVFNNHTLELQAGDRIYLTTDGFEDQCNAQEKRLGRARFRRLIRNLADQAMADQMLRLTEELRDHAGDQHQRDDITIAGIAIH